MSTALRAGHAATSGPGSTGPRASSRGRRLDIHSTAAAVGRAMVGAKREEAALRSKAGSGDGLEDLLSGKARYPEAVPSRLKLNGYSATQKTNHSLDFDEEARVAQITVMLNSNVHPQCVSRPRNCGRG